MNPPQRHANVRILVSNNMQDRSYPRGALVMVAGAGGGDFLNLTITDG
ncbi:unnamed protein product [Rotaria sp. Silwood2]|nr:unnamed protein product [Rotaria sp. Silwood2]